MEGISTESLQNLCLSILERAALDLIVSDGPLNKTTKAQIGYMRNAVEFFSSPHSDESPFTFFSCCEHGGMDYEEAKRLIKPRIAVAREYLRTRRALHANNTLEK